MYLRLQDNLPTNVCPPDIINEMKCLAPCMGVLA